MRLVHDLEGLHAIPRLSTIVDPRGGYRDEEHRSGADRHDHVPAACRSCHRRLAGFAGNNASLFAAGSAKSIQIQRLGRPSDKVQGILSGADQLGI